jgi:hypothetical protein
LIFELTEGRILPLSITNHQSSIINSSRRPVKQPNCGDSSVPSSRPRAKIRPDLVPITPPPALTHPASANTLTPSTMASPIQFYRNFQALMQHHGIRHVLTSGVACVEYGIQQNTKDTDWIIHPVVPIEVILP